MLLFSRYSAPLLSLLLSQFLTTAAAAETNDYVFDPDNLCSTPYATLDLAKANQPLIVPPQETPDEDGVTRIRLALNLAYYNGPVYNTIMRTYNGIAPGPTIHVQPGGSLQIELINCLHHPLGLTGYEAHNRFSDPNTTNLHTHGPHISGESPGDNIFVTVEPQSSTLYEYYFDKNHMPGTAWYHPHFHGSTSLQVGQGVAGMLIIDHPDDYPLPDEVKDMPEIEMIVQNIHLPHLRDAANISKDEVTNYVDHNFERTNATSSSDILMLVNMQFVPVVTMEVNKWYRWRMVMSSIDKTLAFISENQNCEFKLLAKDGIYLTDAPRDVEVVILSPGNRADVAVRCLEVGREKMNMKRIPLNRRFGRFDPEWQPTFVEVDVVPRPHNLFDPPENSSSSSSSSSSELEVFNVPTPCYLVDLRGVDECDIETTFRNRYSCEPSPPWPGRQSPNDLCGLFGPPGDGGGDTGDFFPFVDKDTYILEFPVGTVQEVTMTFAAFHPYHQHVNPFQIHEIQSYNESQIEDYVSTWYQVGDWHDTLQFPHPSGGLNFRFFTNVTVRYQADQFTGKMLQHCQMLQHDDKGMAAVYGVYGEEGTYWEEARRINPTCIEPTSNFTKSNTTKSGVDSTDSRRMGSSKSGKCRRKGKSSKKAPDYSESAYTNATLVTSSNDTSAASSGSTTTVTYVEEPSYSPYSEEPIAEEDDIGVDSDSDADSDSSGDGTAPSTTPKPPTRPSLFEPPTTSVQVPPTTPSVATPAGPTAEESTSPQLPSTKEEVDPKSPSQSVVPAAPSSAVPGRKLLSCLPWIGLLLPLLV
jgi:FtsP/CotA-like multicopper oxidase with cupredoxin domain